MSRPLGVGIAGCGGATQGIHLPALASLPEDFVVRHVYDPDAALAQEVAARAGARHSETFDEVLADADVDVALICSPGSLHAAQVIAACTARKAAVLCEKPFATTVADADAIVAASRDSGVPVLVGTMHRYDPGFRALEAHWGGLARSATLVRSTMVVPPNIDLLRAMTEPVTASPKAQQGSTTRPKASELERLMLDAMVFGLFIHHFPLLRIAMPAIDTVDIASQLGMWGTVITLRQGERVAQLYGAVLGFSHIDWSFELWGRDAHARIDFPPSFLSAQSARATLTTWHDGMTSQRVFDDARTTGYREEWRYLARLARGDGDAMPQLQDARDDVELGTRIVTASGA